MRPGIRLGVDVGSVRMGVASSDPDGLLATPVETVNLDSQDGTGLTRLVDLVEQCEALEIIVGLPLSLDGTHGPAAERAMQFARAAAQALTPVPVRLVDERLSTVEAQHALRSSGRSSIHHREVVDQAAAVVILQSALDSERHSGHPPGELVRTRKPRRRKGPPT